VSGAAGRAPAGDLFFSFAMTRAAFYLLIFDRSALITPLR
jgi:hypothetical protein